MEPSESEPVGEVRQLAVQDHQVVTQIPNLKPVSARVQPVHQENEDLLFLRSLLPYMTGLPLVQRLSLRAEINTAVIKAWEKRGKSGCAENDAFGESKGSS
ncbi:unnamed protein product [Nezara viridula]|uniref:BESS domain-containing protein n=1 Tax=Nezara viridula TaxID=85310 RepID=A0A9P0E925_NEZVI|nr:unnamed protein product [Nezara viridula]